MTNPYAKFLYKNGKPRQNAPEWIKAKYWRVTIMGLTRKQLAGITGYSQRSVVEHEQERGEPLSPDSWRRYRLVCAAVARQLYEFDFDSARPSAKPGRPKNTPKDPAAEIASQ